MNRKTPLLIVALAAVVILYALRAGNSSLLYLLVVIVPAVAVLVLRFRGRRSRAEQAARRPDPLADAFAPAQAAPAEAAAPLEGYAPTATQPTENLWDESGWIVETQSVISDPVEIQRLLKKGRMRAVIPILIKAVILTAIACTGLVFILRYRWLRINPMITLVFLGFYALLLAAILRTGRRSAFNNDYKRLVVHSVLARHFQELYYEPGEGMPASYFRNMVPFGNRYRSNDYFRGRYRGVAFQQADAKLEEETEKKEERSGSIYFHGRSILMESPAPIQGELYIWDNKLRHTCIARVRRQGLFPVQVPDADFNRRFTVYATDPGQALAFLTPQMVERVKGISGGPAGGSPFALKCAGGGLHLCIHNRRDAFEANPLQAVSLRRMEADVLQDLAPLTGAIELLHGV